VKNMKAERFLEKDEYKQSRQLILSPRKKKINSH